MERYLIDDIAMQNDAKKVMKKEFELTIFDSQIMTESLLNWQEWKEYDPYSTIIILPGNGASIVKKYINKTRVSWLNQWPWVFSPQAKRIWIPGENPQVFVSRINSSQMLIGFKNVVVLDDVISSGATIRNLRQINEPWIPGTNWQAITWIKQESASTKGFSKTFAIKTVGTRERKVPINSLSTLIDCREIAKSYAQRNFGNKAELFLKILEGLR